eukprot:CAMPEP_0203752522 /NCGR_PEP_ID=MMETSP0098-20131031/6437_1 /ASSEMBLY_ACC=CAM_ASM_000208 /TAXON_ID=96639 /ORGANISM=" , Strain NY0313808BC1" /LENGTH=252 /DNA_ID=CAMNT_0050642727 /DNA_START=263 /DNA_END=1018 /DNA_ORIENTATION=+
MKDQDREACSLVALIVDMDDAAWCKSVDSGTAAGTAGVPCHNPVTLDGILNGIVVFMNAVRMLNRENEVCIIGEYPDGVARYLSGSGSDVGVKLKRSVREYSKINPESSRQSSLSSALSKALCYTNRVVNSHKIKYGTVPLARVLVIQATEDTSSQYIASMNAAFAAQKQQVCVDVCDFSPGGSKVLQQVAHLTGGILQHYRGVSIGGFMEQLLGVFLSDKTTRGMLKLPPQAPIVLEAACFCCGILRSRGW